MLRNSSLGRYLGVFFSNYHPATEDYKRILQKSQQIINHWEGNFLSKAGRLTLIESNLEALPSYVCDSSMLPADIAHNIDKIHQNFFWKQNKDKNSIPMIVWDTICQPKALGELGLRKTLPTNKAFLAKLRWKIATDHKSLWELMKAKYLRQASLFTYTPKPQDFPIWKKSLL